MLPKTYDPKPVESKWAELWQKKGLFLSDVPEDKSKSSFVIVIPPPNITGALHMGHALNNVLQDVLIRSNRMMGRQAYWVPGMDHGGIATQNVMEKMLKAEKKHKEDLGRGKFLERMWAWYKECGGTILTQLNKLGCALDISPSNVRFTMDETRTKAVFEEFRLLWEKGLIYRGERMINWCVRCRTALSDIEVEHEETHSKLWHIHYPLEDGKKGLVVATTRPESMLGDTAVAVNPGDKRYAGLVGKKVRLPLTGRTIPVVADDAIDISFGTGALKVTPAHDPVDFGIASRHGLEIRQVISFEGKMINSPAKYEGKDRTLCRHEVIEDLRAGGYLDKDEPYKHAVGVCYRCNQHIEPLISEQWFVKMGGLAKNAIETVENNKVRFHPGTWKKPFLEWLENIQDWCISRQIWWGHRMPVWYCAKCSGKGLIFSGGNELKRVSFKKGAKPVVSYLKPGKCPDCGGSDLIQDPDVLDTWFSSALWPFSVFGWPEKTKELAYYYPTSVLVTAYEILYLWVARMVMMGTEFLKEVPFSDVYIHGIVRDRHGKKMSKSLGNVIDPLVLMEKYGTDAVRFSLIYQAIPGRDIQFGEESITGARNFCNKIYNAFRFVLMNLPKKGRKLPLPDKPVELCDRWILDRYSRACTAAADSLEQFDLARAVSELYRFLWDDYCDWYVELSKPRLQSKSKDAVLAILVNVLANTLKALHPFMPYITEELFRELKPFTSGDRALKDGSPPALSRGSAVTEGSREAASKAPQRGGAEFLLQESFPRTDGKYLDESAVSEMEVVMGITTALRTLRSQFDVPPAKTVGAVVSCPGGAGKTASAALNAVQSHRSYIAHLAKLKTIEAGAGLSKPPHSATAVFGGLTLYMPLEGIIDFDKERARLKKEHEKISRELRMWEEKLSNPNFVKFAPEPEVKKIRQRKDDALNRSRQMETALKDLE